MRRYFILILILSLYFSSTKSLKAVEIHLVDGRVLTAESYWEENDFIKYERNGGMVSIDKKKVLRIESPTNDKVAEEGNVYRKARKIYNDWCRERIKHHRYINSSANSPVHSMSDGDIASQLRLEEYFEGQEKNIVDMINNGFTEKEIISDLGGLGGDSGISRFQYENKMDKLNRAFYNWMSRP
jgi:hypothetical protein